MAVIRCDNGHLFDSRVHGSICPVCHMVMEKQPLPEQGTRFADQVEARLLYEEIDPVCGWLACYEGPRQGQSFVLHTGKNFIGRADDMDVRLLGDDQIARRNHAIIAYDNKNREFMLIPGDSDGMVYLNGSAIYSPTLLLDMNSIQLGKAKLVFRPLCGENFAWDVDTSADSTDNLYLVR